MLSQRQGQVNLDGEFMFDGFADEEKRVALLREPMPDKHRLVRVVQSNCSVIITDVRM